MVTDTSVLLKYKITQRPWVSQSVMVFQTPTAVIPMRTQREKSPSESLSDTRDNTILEDMICPAVKIV